MFGPPIALAIGAKFVPLRKPRKLPGESSAFTHSHFQLIAFAFFNGELNVGSW